MSVLDAIDQGAFVFFQHHRQHHPQFPQVMSYITELGGNVAFVMMGAAAIGLALKAGRMRSAILVLITFLATAGAIEGTKFLVAAPRPPDAIDSSGKPDRSGSFPSGHTAKATVGLSVLMLLGLPILGFGKVRLVLYVLTGVVIGLAGFSRFYLGVHYATDCFGGWALGLLIVLIWYKFEISRPVVAEAGV